jgi:cell division protein FtsB
MRTTLTLDDDIADSLREQARLLDKPFKQVVNETLRRGLSPAVKEHQAPYRIVPIHSGFLPGIDPLKLNQLNDELEVEDFLEERARDDSPGR